MLARCRAKSIPHRYSLETSVHFCIEYVHFHTGQCKRTGGCYNELVVAFYSTGGGVKGKNNLYLLTLFFIYKLAFILFVMTPGAQTTGNIAVYGSAK